MAKLARLTVDLVANAKALNAGLASAQAKVQGFAANVQRAMGKLNAVLAVAAGVGGISALINSVDRLTKVAQKLGTTTEALSRLRFAASQTGIAASTLDMALQRMVRRVSEAAAGTGEAQAALKELGLDAKRLNKLGLDEQLKEIAKAMQRVDRDSDKLRLAFKLFDSEGAELVRLLGQGEKGLDKLFRRADALGITIKTEDAKRIERFSDKLDESMQALRGVIISVLLPALEQLALALKGLTSLLSALNAVGKQIDKAVGKEGFTGEFAERSQVALHTYGLSEVGRLLGVITDDAEEASQSMKQAARETAQIGKLPQVLRAGTAAAFTQFFRNQRNGAGSMEERRTRAAEETADNTSILVTAFRNVLSTRPATIAP